MARADSHPDHGGRIVIRVLLVDDQQLVREGLRRILHADEGFEIVGECSGGDEVIDAVARARPGSDRHGHPHEARRRRGGDPAGSAPFPTHRRSSCSRRSTTTRCSQVRCAPERPASSSRTHAGEELVARRAGGRGGRRVARPGRHRPGPDGVSRGARRTDRRVGATTRSLTSREIDVLRRIGQGATNQEIAATLFVSEATVKSHVGHIFAKLGVRDRAAAIVFAFDHRLVTPS